MKYPTSICTALIAAALGAGVAFAQNAPAPAPAPTPTEPAPVVSDVGPTPAQERSSMGAIIMDDSLRAQRDRDFEESSSRTGVASVGRGDLRERMRAKAQAELAQARAAEAAELRRRGAGALTEN
jgi:outer membrane receptor protein involved in Fe transport